MGVDHEHQALNTKEAFHAGASTFPSGNSSFAERLGRPCTRLAAFRGHAGARYVPLGTGTKSYRPVEPMPWGDLNRRVAPREGKPPADTPEKHEGH